MSELPVSRAPGFLERYYICRDTTGIMGRGFNMSVKLNEPVSDLILSHALRRVIISCPYLTVNAFLTISEDTLADGKNYHIRPVKRLLFSKLVYRKTVRDFDARVLEDLSRVRLPVNRGKPGWYLTRISVESSGDQYLTFACNHVMFDGRSAVNFFDDLVKTIDIVSGYTLSDVAEVLFDSEVDSPGKLRDSSENVTNLYDSPLWFKLSTLASQMLIPSFVLKLFSSYVWPSSPNFYQHPPFNLVPFNGLNEANFRIVHFSREEVSLILTHCKQERTTLTPMMAARLYLAIGTSFTAHLGTFSQSCELIICGRRYFPKEKQITRYGLFFSAFTSYIAPGLSTKDATEVLKKGLSQAMKNRHSFYKTGLLQLLNIWNYMKPYAEDKAERQTFEISNLGRVDISAGKWHVTDVVFSQGVTFSHITLSVISTPKGGMNVVISYHEDFSKVSEGGILMVDRCIEKFRENMLDV
ncbi:hypothetical protein METBIDRAFT_45992 [Metschnikowia bicuspidata var. bicuspidata NRRL YB-4993]|uniref:Alcohol acetyltransferase n=1 Tax=Metschnikowia bicuspidata var. bicuspidata NRRL YB-4993 TaxID=869754 RepID=A0A1A0H6G9_9ASCO|nr:hypothetical protein METBIDRAFT_45992 [Metschnikowia bicuspidata var. bicuspidata NRRL YB-4993]OBA19679.1 hypothetical protein METBIDRAFT_45992 [Metschnikowia bicuspidata var. bicuspidata NRRL YB-4993]